VINADLIIIFIRMPVLSKNLHLALGKVNFQLSISLASDPGNNKQHAFSTTLYYDLSQ